MTARFLAVAASRVRSSGSLVRILPAEDNDGADRVSGTGIGEQGSRLAAFAGTHLADVDGCLQAGQVHLATASVTPHLRNDHRICSGVQPAVLRDAEPGDHSPAITVNVQR
jgi:hypothetical protein